MRSCASSPEKSKLSASGARDIRRANDRPRVCSGTRDHLEGGDLDLYLEVEPGHALANEMAFRDLIERPLDELKVDVVFHERGAPFTPIE